MINAATTSTTAVLESARLLRQLHALDRQGKHNSDDAEAVRDQMDVPWDAMESKERERMRWLSEDLYVFAEGGPPRVAMSEPEIQAWKKGLEDRRNRYQAGDIDGWLEFLRKPRPDNLPAPSGIDRADIHLFQAQCWDKLGDPATAALFRTAAEDLLMEQLAQVA